MNKEVENRLIAIWKKIEALPPSTVIMGLYLIKIMAKQTLLEGSIKSFVGRPKDRPEGSPKVHISELKKLLEE